MFGAESSIYGLGSVSWVSPGLNGGSIISRKELSCPYHRIGPVGELKLFAARRVLHSLTHRAVNCGHSPLLHPSSLPMMEEALGDVVCLWSLRAASDCTIFNSNGHCPPQITAPHTDPGCPFLCRPAVWLAAPLGGGGRRFCMVFLSEVTVTTGSASALVQLWRIQPEAEGARAPYTPFFRDPGRAGIQNHPLNAGTCMPTGSRCGGLIFLTQTVSVSRSGSYPGFLKPVKSCFLEEV